MIHRARRSRSPLAALFVLALTACGGKGGGSTTPRNPDGVPFDQEAVRAKVAATAAADTDGCAVDGAATVGDAMRSQKALLAADGGDVGEAFRCQKSVLADDTWECTLEVSRAPAGGEDDEGSAFQAIVQVDHEGALKPGQILCVAPG